MVTSHWICSWHFWFSQCVQPTIVFLWVKEDALMDNATKTFLRIVSFYVRKLMNWIQTDILSLVVWKKLINSDSLLHRMTYEARECPNKFTTIWLRWVVIWHHCGKPLMVWCYCTLSGHLVFSILYNLNMYGGIRLSRAWVTWGNEMGNNSLWYVFIVYNW